MYTSLPDCDSPDSYRDDLNDLGLSNKVLFEKSNQIICCLCAYFAPLRLRGLEFFTSLSIKATEDVCVEIERVHRFAWNVLH